MTLYEKIMQIYPNLTDDDLNGIGDYIKEWNHSEYAKPSQEQIKD